LFVRCDGQADQDIAEIFPGIDLVYQASGGEAGEN
jgi:hypothetical protein